MPMHSLDVSEIVLQDKPTRHFADARFKFCRGGNGW